LRQYRISAHILDHDIRLNANLRTQVLPDHTPTQEEALVLLQPVIDSALARNVGEGTFCEVNGVEIEDVGRVSGYE
jgi:hypothetical protein